MDPEKLVQLLRKILRKTIVDCEEQMSKCYSVDSRFYAGRIVLAKDILYIIEGSPNG